MNYTKHQHLRNNIIKSSVLFLLLSFTFSSTGQNLGGCATSIDPTEIYQPPKSYANSSDTWLYKYRTPEYWIPNNTTPIKTIRVNWVVCRDDNGGNGWQDSQTFRNEVNRMFDSINHIYSNSLPKGYSLTCPPQYAHISDTRIRFELNDIIFINNTLFNQCGVDQMYTIYSIIDYVHNTYPSSSNALTHIFTQPSNPSNTAWGQYDAYYNNYSFVITQGSMLNQTTVVWSDHIAHIAHEYGHAVGLGHTYDQERTCLSHFDFLNDVFGECSENITPCIHFNESCDDDNVCYLPKSWFETNTPPYPLMSGCMSGSRYISPKSMGRMHRDLSLYGNRFVIPNEAMHKYVKEKYSYSIPLTITTNETWDFAIKMYQDIVITNNATLTVTGEVKMPIDGKIIVQPGSKLIIDGGRITSAHEQPWQGIEVWGNSSTHQSSINGVCGQGWLELRNGAVIENAKCAVELWRPDYWTTTGGVIHASDATFRNNAMAVRAVCYQNYHPYTHVPLNYNAYFNNCSFIVDNDYLGTETFQKHVVLAEVDGIAFSGCDFSANRSVSGVDPWCIGISAYDAHFSVTSPCTTNNTPCPDEEMDHSTFTGLCSGIRASSDGRHPRSFTVRNTLFINNDFGIHAENTDFPTILFNDFRIGGICDFNYGVCLRNVTGFCIEENLFRPYSKSKTTTVGIAVYHSNGVNDIYRNTFLNLSRANLALGQNTTGGTNSTLLGLTYSCNDFNGNQRDIMVLQRDGAGDIQSQQGSSSCPSGNTFSNSIFQIYNDGLHQIDYYYNSSEADETPTPSLLYRVNRYGTTNANACATHYGNSPIVKSPSEKSALEAEYLSAYNAYSDLRRLYESHMDNSGAQDPTADNSPTTEMLQIGAQMAYYSHKYRLAAGDIIRSNLNDSIANPTELRTWLGNMNDIAADRMAISSYLQEGDSASAFALANTLPALYGLQGSQLSDHEDYIRLLQLHQTLNSTHRNVFQLTQKETDLVAGIADNGNGVSQSMARAMMEQLSSRETSSCIDPELPDSERGEKGWNGYTGVASNRATASDVTLSPNPATTWTTVNYTLPGNTTKAVLTLTNMLGVNVLTKELEDVQGNKVIDLRGLATGVYVYTIQYEQFTETGKLVITK